MNYSASELIQIITTTLTGLGTLYVIVKQAQARYNQHMIETKVDAVSNKADEIKTQASDITKQTEVIHTQTNGRMSKIEEELAETRRELKSALAQIKHDDEVRRELANKAKVETSTDPLVTLE